MSATSVEASSPAACATGEPLPRILQVRTQILKKNDELARAMRAQFRAAGVFVVNVVSSPGAGKTELLSKLLTRLRARGLRVAAVVGDLATNNDATRLAASGAPTRQILTGTMCHLEADMVSKAIEGWPLTEFDFLFIENVGNLVCPASFDLGEDCRWLLFPCTEGEDKPLKYPTLINTADAVILSKMDIAEAVGFDRALATANTHSARASLPIFATSALTGLGLDELIEDLLSRRATRPRSAAQALA
ncbi:MAG: hydrogenase nickel incorporation protein HypB [Planctomycetota bacterium]|nr:hydrogenase nickel incorporation protein HypB [Planctomycetota bacterium]